MLTKCVNCRFYVSNFERKCPNCGRVASLKKVSAGYFQIAQKPFLFALFFSLILVFPFSIWLLGDDYSLFKSVIVTGSALTLIFLALFSIQYKRQNIPTDFRADDALSSLRGKQKLIEKRVAELGKRGQKIDVILDRIKETDSSQLQDVRLKLLAARQIVVSHFARYELQARKIELVRLQNDVLPYLFGLHRLNDFETENGLVTIEISQEEIKRIRQNLTRYDAIEFPESVLPEREIFLSQLEETANSCAKLREAILSRQATRALREISPIKENLRFPASKDLAHATETFNINATLTDFSESFEELEREYRRMRAESEIKLTEN